MPVAARLEERGFLAVTLWAFEANERAARFYRAARFTADPAARKQLTIGGKMLWEVRSGRALTRQVWPSPPRLLLCVESTAMSRAPDTLQFPGRIGLGTWQLGLSASARPREVAAVLHALEVGYRLLDTAEMYAEGGAERVIGEALKSYGHSRRSELMIVSKVLPGNASRAGTIAACEASIRRMGCEYIDLYLLHWAGHHPFTETLRGFQELLQRKLVRCFGVSNLDVGDLRNWFEAEKSVGLAAPTVKCNQVYYNVEKRGIEFSLLPWQREHAIQTMAYSPLGQGPLARHPVLVKLGQQRGVSAAQVALAWCIREPDVVAVPKSVDPRRIEDNFAAGQLILNAAELAQIDHAFPPPRSKRPLETL